MKNDIGDDNVIKELMQEFPNDEVIEISLYKMLYNLESATEEEKNKAKEWLESRGLDVFLM